MIKRISVLGSTGSIGVNTLNVARNLGRENIQVVGLAARNNIDLLEEQVKEFHPEIVAVYDETKALELRKRLPHVPILEGMDGLKAVAAHSQANFVVSAIVGTLGIIPTVAAIEAGKQIGLANKEVLVSGGAFIIGLAKKHQVDLLPIDSEHSAIFQCLHGQKKDRIRRLIITASGGPFRNHSASQLDNVSVADALKHPSWNMGPKITIDSSTLMNKGLEVIEAHWLFGIAKQQIEVVVHPQSIIHSMVEFADQSIMAQMGYPHMMMPIQYALTYPERLPSTLTPFDFTKNAVLEFFPPDYTKFPCLQLAFDSIGVGRSLPCYMNAANEVLVNRFINKEIGWKDISTGLARLMEKHHVMELGSLDDVLHVDQQARREAQGKGN